MTGDRPTAPTGGARARRAVAPSRPAPDDRLEREAGAGDGRVVFGVDEVGRGPLAGPVAAAAAWIDLGTLPVSARAAIADSKSLTADRRQAALTACTEHARFALGWAGVAEIARLNILNAALLAMERAVTGLAAELGRAPDLVLVDGNRAPRCPHPIRTVVKGDAVCLSIALASIAAKQARDREMRRLAAMFPGYGWERNAGYGTAAHREAIGRLGVTPHHRRGFAPVRAALARPAES